MTNDNGLLAHLAPRFTSRVEELATEALGYILSRSTEARAALTDLMRRNGANVRDIARVQTQVSYENGASRPDLVGFDVDGAESVIFEVKFWAGLAWNQVSGYFHLLPLGRPSVLLIVGPEARRELLWSEIQRQMPHLGAATEENGVRSSAVDEHHWVMLTSWRKLLEKIDSPGLDAHEDIRQLQALCERQDEDTFLPLADTELGPGFPRRVVTLNRLIDNVIDGRKEEIDQINLDRLRATAQRHGYGRFLRLGRDGAWAQGWFGADVERWAKFGGTPLWINFHGTQDMKLDEIRNKLSPLTQRVPPEAFDGNGVFSVAVHLPTGVEEGTVSNAIVARLQEIANLIKGNSS